MSVISGVSEEAEVRRSSCCRCKCFKPRNDEEMEMESVDLSQVTPITTRKKCMTGFQGFVLVVLTLLAISQIICHCRVSALEKRSDKAKANLNRTTIVPDSDSLDTLENTTSFDLLNAITGYNDSDKEHGFGFDQIFEEETQEPLIREKRVTDYRDIGIIMNLLDKIPRLKAKLDNCRHSKEKCLKKLELTKKSNPPGSKAVYIIPTGNNVDIHQPKQLIGPWYMAQNGSQFGFNDLWYNGLVLDPSGLRITTSENGLFLIFSQVYYHISPAHGDSPVPMGYRILLKKNRRGENKIQFPIPFPIAQCVVSYPSTFYQTCFTQVAWYLEIGDQIYFEHYTKSFPMIEAEKFGKTFIVAVKLT